MHVEAEAEGDDETRDDDVTEAEHGEVGGGTGLGREQLDRRVDALGDGDHHGSCEDLPSVRADAATDRAYGAHPEDVVDEQQPEKEECREERIELEQSKSSGTQGQSEEVGQDIRSSKRDVEKRNGNGEGQEDQSGQ